ncbi:hypothetical protein PY824_03735 [Streptococcus macedonicus]|uniref:Uncharacterized protein n=1 Tax=Streptococcus gallolyticus TaxID=315405 RepID=A0A380K5G3_9STRE|nr:hypothetical protein [Streptococcus macedonicus]WGK79913.1 hypothetical protein PY824_03735 [Streptococcus macedonicus]SUN60105.1 Uncharacterised protein [Streptococcus gallolyticus]
MGTINTNKSAAKHCVIFNRHQNETPFDVLEKFIEWTKEKNIKSYIEVSKLLYTTPNEANRLLNLAVLPDDRIIERMKGLMHGKQC